MGKSISSRTEQPGFSPLMVTNLRLKKANNTGRLKRRIYLHVQVRQTLFLSLFTQALQGVHALSGNGSNKKEHLLSLLASVYVIFLSFFQAHLLCWAHIVINPLKKSKSSMNEILQVLFKGYFGF